MLISSPFPDELALGHLYRLIRLNDTYQANKSTNQSQLANWIANMRPKVTPAHHRRVPINHMLANSLGVSVASYRYNHSLCFFGSRWRHLSSQDPKVDIKLGAFSLPTFSKLAPGNESPYKLCRLCRQEDITAYGMTYWHRIHQVPGIDICPHHLTPLQHHTERDVINNPNPFALNGPLVAAELVQAAHHPILERYRTLAALTLSFGEGIELLGVINHVRDIARELVTIIGVAWSNPNTSPLAHYLPDKHLPPVWLGHHIDPKTDAQSNAWKNSGIKEHVRELRCLQDVLLFHPGYLLLAMAAIFTTPKAAEILLGHNPKTAINSLRLGQPNAKIFKQEK